MDTQGYVRVLAATEAASPETYPHDSACAVASTDDVPEEHLGERCHPRASDPLLLDEPHCAVANGNRLT